MYQRTLNHVYLTVEIDIEVYSENVTCTFCPNDFRLIII